MKMKQPSGKGYLEQLLELVTQECNIHEIIWPCNFEGEFEGPVEGRYFDSLGYPIFLTNASGYMSPKIENRIYTFINGIEDVFLPRASYFEMWKLLAEKPRIDYIMTVIRQLCATIFKERQIAAIPIKQALQSATILGIRGGENRYHPDVNDWFKIKLDTKITGVLIKEGEARNIVRNIQAARKNTVNIGDKIEVVIPDYPYGYEDFIKRETLTEKITRGRELKIMISN